MAISARRLAAAFGFALAAVVIGPPSAALAKVKQCVNSVRAGFSADVKWYAPGSLTIDNSEPWNNRVLLRRTENKKNGYPCGVDIETGETVCQGLHIKPIKTERIHGNIGGLVSGTTESCIEGGGDYVAIVHCAGCTQGVSFLKAAASTLAGAAVNFVTPATAIGQIIDQATTWGTTAAGSQGYSVGDGLDAAFSQAKKGFKFGQKLPRAVPIHDVSDLGDPGNLVYFGTPTLVGLSGTVGAPQAREQTGVQADSRSRTWDVKIDCYNPNIGYRGTKNVITVRFYDENWKFLAESFKSGHEINCDTNLQRKMTTWTSGRLYDKKTGDPLYAKYIKLKTNGEDAFFIDQVFVTFYNPSYSPSRSGNLVDGYTFRPDSTTGNLCLSLDTDDGKSWKDVMNKKYGCQPEINFKLK